MAAKLERATSILDELGRQMPFLLRATASAPCSPIDGRLPELELIATRLRDVLGEPSTWLEEVVGAYCKLSIEFLRLQQQLEKTGRYLLSTEREALQRVYNNPEVFGEYYLSGLLLSEALWPNHFRLNQAFIHRFLPSLPPAPCVLEVGVGTGYHLLRLIQGRPEVSYSGLDISGYAIDFAKRFSGCETASSQTSFALGNVSDGLPFENAKFDGIILGEILEHVENPAAVLRTIAAHLRPGGRAFMTTVAFTANIDHIYMFESVAEIRAMIESCGWQIEQEWPLPVYPNDEAEVTRRPINYGAMLRRSHQ